MMRHYRSALYLRYNTNYLFMSLVSTSNTHKQHIENIAAPGMVAASTSLYYISLSLGFRNIAQRGKTPYRRL